MDGECNMNASSVDSVNDDARTSECCVNSQKIETFNTVCFEWEQLPQRVKVQKVPGARRPLVVMSDDIDVWESDSEFWCGHCGDTDFNDRLESSQTSVSDDSYSRPVSFSDSHNSKCDTCILTKDSQTKVAQMLHFHDQGLFRQ